MTFRSEIKTLIRKLNFDNFLRGPFYTSASVLGRRLCGAFAAKQTVCIFTPHLKSTFFFFFFKFQSSVKWILMGRTQSSVPVELHTQVSLAAACAVNDGEGKECLRRSAL